MKSYNVVALTALLSSSAQAVPMAGHKHAAPVHGHLHLKHKRDVVWVTKTEVETVVVMKTVFPDGSEPSQSAQYSSSAVTVAPTSATSTEETAPTGYSPSEAGSSSAPPAYTPPATTSEAPVPTTSSASSFTTSTSSYVAPPAPTTTEQPVPTTYAPAPAPTTTYSPEPAPLPSYSSSAPAPSASAPSGGYSGGGSTSAGASYSGDATHWDPAMGACGWTNNSGEDVVAISQTLFDPSTPGGNPNNNPLCGRTLSIKGKDGSTYSAKVVDRCVGCQEGDLDMTMTLFNKATSNGDGRVGGMEWQWD